MSDERARRILLVTSDLMASTRIADAAGRLGHAVDVRGSPAALAGELAPDLVLIDIQSCADPADAIGRARDAVGPDARIVAFGPHVWKDRLEAAVAAGADAAASRGEVLEGLAALLCRLDAG